METIVTNKNKSLQDENLSIAADEFVWQESGVTPIHRLVLKPIVNLLKKHSATKVLDLGCGNGAFTHLLKQQGFNIEGFDGSASGIQIAQKNYSDTQFSQLDLVTGEIPEKYYQKFDSIVSVEVIEHLLLPRMLMQNAMRALKPGGLLIITTPYHGYWKNLAIAINNGFDAHWHPLRDYGHIKFFSKQTLTQLFEEYQLEKIGLQTVGRIPPIANSIIISGIKSI